MLFSLSVNAQPFRILYLQGYSISGEKKLSDCSFQLKNIPIFYVRPLPPPKPTKK